jgi:hypothetical protein
MQIWTFCAPVNQPKQRTALPVHGDLYTWQGDQAYRTCRGQGRVREHRAGSRFLPEFEVPAECGLGRHSAEQLDEATRILATFAEVPQRASA